jgi:hypothetical protein
MKNIKFSSIEEADLFVDSHAESIGGAMTRLKALDKLMENGVLYGVRECLDPNSPHYVHNSFSRQFAEEMQSIGVNAFVEKMMNAQRHYWGKRRKLQDFASKRIECATTRICHIEPGQAIAIYDPLTYFDRTVYAVNSLAYKQLESQKPLLIDWFVKAHKSNPTFNLTTTYKANSDGCEYYDMTEIGIDDAIKILDNGYIVPHISVKTTYLVPQQMQTSDGSVVFGWKYGDVGDDWDSFSTSLDISFSSVQSEHNYESHLYGQTIYLWNGTQPCIN